MGVAPILCQLKAVYDGIKSACLQLMVSLRFKTIILGAAGVNHDLLPVMGALLLRDIFACFFLIMSLNCKNATPWVQLMGYAV